MLCITCSFFFDTILDLSNNSCRKIFCLFFIFNYSIPNNRLCRDVVTDILVQPLYVVIKLHMFSSVYVFLNKDSTSRVIQGFIFIPCYSRSSLIFFFFNCFRIIILKYNPILLFVVVLQFISVFLFLWLYFIWYLSFSIICYLVFDLFSWYCAGLSYSMFSWCWPGWT